MRATPPKAEPRQDKRQGQEAVAAKAAAVWASARPAHPDHPYLRAKRIQPHKLRQSGQELLVPLWDMAGKLWSLQMVAPNGRKLFPRGGRVTGCFSPIGFSGPPERLIICEGWATGATLCKATGWPVLVAMNAGNLLPVAKVARQACPAADIVLAADNGRQTEGNPGLRNATKAALAIGGRLAVPSFPEAAEGSDLNDFFRCCSKSGVTGVTNVAELEAAP